MSLVLCELSFALLLGLVVQLFVFGFVSLHNGLRRRTYFVQLAWAFVSSISWLLFSERSDTNCLCDQTFDAGFVVARSWAFIRLLWTFDSDSKAF